MSMSLSLSDISRFRSRSRLTSRVRIRDIRSCGLISILSVRTTNPISLVTRMNLGLTCSHTPYSCDHTYHQCLYYS